MKRLGYVKDGQCWLVGCAADTRWLEDPGGATNAATAPVPFFEAYCRVKLPVCSRDADAATVDVLAAQADHQHWWLGYLDFGIGIDLVFNEAPRTRVFGWDYVLVRAGPLQARGWRSQASPEEVLRGGGPELIFPEDHSWLLFKDWDEPSTMVGGSTELIDRILTDPMLSQYACRVSTFWD